MEYRRKVLQDTVDMSQKYDSRRRVAQLSEKFKMELNALVDRC